MLLLVILVGINKALQALKYHYMKIGVDAEGYTISVYIFAFIKGSLSILIIVLIASGWMFIKPFLSDKDKRVISVVIPLQIIANVANVMASETAIGSVNWSFWSKLLPLVDMLAFVVVLWPILLTRKHLSSTTEIAGKETANLSKYRLWSTFYIVTIIYLYLTRVVVLLLHALLPFRYVTWVGELFSEVVTLAFWTFIGYKFRPYANNPYTQVPEDDDGDDVEGILREDTLPLHAVVRRVEREAED
ncbi:hypothetical protein BC937DRAFT_86844 [Endogone sp. FLAS-F59071]|nr:hypothetical protein BC937DRAFT_86844 [Endogone sp. FLAS-F59071]|eukprot:RUS19831.1 hypothetical protein BC937DRAFT_86844 [Endogone sp. FLAS-F59071]